MAAQARIAGSYTRQQAAGTAGSGHSGQRYHRQPVQGAQQQPAASSQQPAAPATGYYSAAGAAAAAMQAYGAACRGYMAGVTTFDELQAAGHAHKLAAAAYKAAVAAARF